MSSFSLSPCDNYVRFCVHRLRYAILSLRLHEIFVLRLRLLFLRHSKNKKSTLKRVLICGRNARNPYISRDFSCINTEVLRCLTPYHLIQFSKGLHFEFSHLLRFDQWLHLIIFQLLMVAFYYQWLQLLRKLTQDPAPLWIVVFS